MDNLNKDVLIKSLILLFFILIYMILLVKDKLKLYVHPKYSLVVICAVIIFLIIFICIASDIFTINIQRLCYKNYLVFIAALIIILFSALCNFKNLSYDNNIVIHSKPYYNNVKSLTYDNDVIEINKYNFLPSIDEILTNPDKYEGFKIKIDGFIYKDDNLTADDQFIIARYMTAFSSSHMQISGIKCQSNTLINYTDYTWVEINGIIHTKHMPNSDNDTIILIESIKELDNPDTSYIYPNLLIS